jgi:TPR repeat protein
MAYLSGEGVPVNPARGVFWLRQAAREGYSDAQDLLGDLYQHQGNYAQAVKWYRAAAAAGNPRGEYYLGEAYASGKGVRKAERQALSWFHKAAIGGDAHAQALRGVQYMIGQAVPRNPELAYAWVAVASRSAQHFRFTRKVCDAIARQLTPVQLKEARRLARQWTAGHSMH